MPFVLWWLYFCEEENLSSEERNHVFLWGYGHYIIFASAAAIGAGFAALIDASGDHPHGDPNAALWVISTSIFLYIFGLWFIRDRHVIHKKSASLLLMFAVLILLTPLFQRGSSISYPDACSIKSRLLFGVYCVQASSMERVLDDTL